MQVRTLFLVCMSVVATLGAVLGGWLLTQMVLEYQLAGRVEQAVEIDTLLFMASDKIGAERPATGNALLADAAIDPPARARLSALRAATDSVLMELTARIQPESYPGAAEQLAIVQNSITDLAGWRGETDRALEQPKSQRDPDLFERYLGGVISVFDATNSALDLGDMVASLHDGTTVELIGLSRSAWVVRLTLGLRTAELLGVVDRGVALTPTQERRQTRLDGVLDATWVSIATLGRRLGDLKNVTAAIATGRAAFNAFDELCHELINASREGRAYPISARELGRHASATSPVLLDLRDHALLEARTRALEHRQTAGRYVIVAGVVLGLSIIAVTSVLMVLQRRIVFPVLALTEAIGRIARQEFNVTIPARQRSDEIGRMADALDALRAGAMAGEENKARIIRMAHRDALTDLANRVALQERLEHVVAMSGRGQTSAVLCVDLDRFKAVNDTFGHPIGDLLLKAVADRLLACAREVDMVSRVGGDEFVILLVALQQPEQAGVVAGRIVRTLSEPFDLEGRAVSIGCSIGIALTPRDANSATAMMKCADTALYRAKTEGKGTWRCFQPEMDAHLRERTALEQDLREAVRTEGLDLAYQPLYRLAHDPAGEDRLSGFEALLRWRHAERGSVGPGVFVPIAEETGLIVQIGAWVLRRACAEAMHWPDDVKVAVNLSAIQFKNLDLVQIVRQALAGSGLPPHRLELEITETVLLSSNAAILSMLHEMHGMGIHIAMDDFGTGYSSLSYLRSFPFDTIKIDQSFVRDMTENESARTIVRSVVALANSLGMTTTAEGVETASQLAELRRQGCTDAQGYLFSKPVGADRARVLAARSPSSLLTSSLGPGNRGEVLTS